MSLRAVLLYASCELLLYLLGSLSAAAAERVVTVGECLRHFADDPVARRSCLIEATTQQSTAPQVAAPRVNGLASPLANLIVIFGFFDRRFTSYNGGLEHAGVDFAAAPGTPVYAMCDGAVALSRTDQAPVMSAVLVVEHQCPQPLGRVYGYYGHVQSHLTEGEAVSAGASIGTVRDWQSNSHLHFGMSTQLIDDNWGTYPRGVTLEGLEGQGWLNPLHYFTAAHNGELKRVAPQPTVNRQNRARNIPGKRRR